MTEIIKAATTEQWLLMSVRALIWATDSMSKLEREKIASFFDLKTDDLNFLRDVEATFGEVKQ